MSTIPTSFFRRTAPIGFAGVLVLGFSNVGLTEPTNMPGLPALPESAKQRILGHLQEANLTHLKGWPGIIFYCPTVEAQSPALREICLESYKNLERLAVQNHLQFRKAQNLNEVTLLPHLTGQLKLVIDLQGSSPGDSASAIAETVSVMAHYTGAVNRTQEHALEDGQNKHPQMVPQHVDALLWEASSVKAASGGQQELVKPTIDVINRQLDAFFAAYAKANQQ